ncbi:MAG TPA: glycosyltransferase family 2 protein, partial [Patescibacteria group bacterium]|nr:glycosyltransferase family 2 protein [Patescibacteria group bacterium]
EKNIGQCLENLSWCDELIVVDDESSDTTVSIAKKKGATVFIHALQGDFAAQRNYGLEKAKGEWVFFVDADERVSQSLWYEIMAKTNEPANVCDGYFLKRRDTLWKKQLRYGEIGNIRLLRLAKKNAGRWQGKVHEVWKVTGKTDVLQNALEHFPHQTIKEFLEEINYYSTLRAEELKKKKVHASWLTILVYPKVKFIVNYFLRKGFLDGIPGLVLALMMSLHSFLVRGKLWLLWKRTKNNE